MISIGAGSNKLSKTKINESTAITVFLLIMSQ